MKLLLQLAFLCLFASSSMMAQQTKKVTVHVTKKTQVKDCKKSKNNGLKKQHLVVARNAIRKTNHREMIDKSKRIAANY